MIEAIQAQLKLLLRHIGISHEVQFSVPPDPKLGDVAIPCFQLAKSGGEDPTAFAKILAGKLQQQAGPESLVEAVQSEGPYLNITLNSNTLATILIREIQKESSTYGTTSTGFGKTMLIEYPSENTHKDFHIGHVRVVCVGNALVGLYRNAGHTVIPVNYINDFGSHVARCIWGIKKFHAGEEPAKNKHHWLGQVYAEASMYLKDHEEFVTEVVEIQRELESREGDAYELYLKTRQWSLDAFKKFYEELGLYHEKIFYENEVKDAGQRIVDELLEKNIAKEGEGGAIIVDLTNDNLDVALLRKSNGAGLYLTSDLGLSITKKQTYPDIFESINITGSEQDFYFKQLYRLLELYGFEYKMSHIGCGLVTLPSGKMSSRTGDLILFEDVRNELVDRFYSETNARHPDWAPEEIRETATKLAYAALKFSLLKHESAKGVVFDSEEAVSIEGYTAPYVLYTIARINSLIKNFEESIPHIETFNSLREAEEKRLLIQLASYPVVVERAFHEYNPAIVTRYCFDLAQAYNDFYNRHSVLNADSGELVRERLVLSLSVAKVLERAFQVLGIEVVGRM